jgi:hypothetical protein
MFKGLKLLRTYYRVNGGPSLVGRKVTLPTSAPANATALLRQPCPPLCLPLGLIMFLLLLSRIMSVEKVNHVTVEEA